MLSLVFEHQNDSAVHTKELLTEKPLLVYTVFGSLSVDIDHIQRRVEIFRSSRGNSSPMENLEEIERPLYGLKLKKMLDNGIAVLVQMEPTYVKKRYLFAELTSTARLFVEEHEDGISVFVVSANEKFDTNYLLGIIGS